MAAPPPASGCGSCCPAASLPARAAPRPGLTMNRLPPARNEAFLIQGGVNYDVLAWPMNGDAARKVLSRVMSYEYLWQAIREQGGAYGAGMLSRAEFELIYTYRDPPCRRQLPEVCPGAGSPGRQRVHPREPERVHRGHGRPGGFAPQAPPAGTGGGPPVFLRGHRSRSPPPTGAAMCGVTAEWLRQQAGSLAGQMARGVRCTFGSRARPSSGPGICLTLWRT